MTTDPFFLRDPKRAQGFQTLLHRLAPKSLVKIVHVCGTHEITIVQHGLRSLLPENVEVFEGPGCPVCVTSTQDFDCALRIAERGAIICTFGDMTRVPGTRLSLEEARAEGADVRVVLSASDAVDIARANPQRPVVFFAAGFETTAPGTAAVLLADPPDNFFVLMSHKLIPPTLEALLSENPREISAFLAPGHVSTIIGAKAYRPLAEKFGVPVVIAGFEPLDILYGIALVLRQMREGRAEVENAYPRAVREEGNLRAQELFREVFQVGPAIWRGIGEIPSSGFYLREEFAHHDARREFGVVGEVGEEKPPGCRCADVLTAKAIPTDCPLYAQVCTPLTPVGPCMVGAEGACNIWYRYMGRPRL